MKYKTQFTAQEIKKTVFEETGNQTPVVKTIIRGNSEKLAQMQLAGVYAEGQRLGYHFEADDLLPKYINPPPGKGTDVIDVLRYAENLSHKIREAVVKSYKGDSNVGHETTGVPEEGSKSLSNASGSPGKGVSKDEAAGTDGSPK